MLKRNQSTVEIRKRRVRENIRNEKLRKEREKIVEFFLDLYNVQLKGWEKAPKKYSFVGQTRESGYTYELKVKHFGKWASRPMGIAPIGGEGGSKSTCYKVTYDDILVVKIPRKPITELDDYIKGLKTERQIAAQIMPNIQCIAPGVSPILKRVPPFFNGMCWVPEEVEEKSVERLRQFRRFEQYLKIGDTFAFFMDISKYSFLVQIISQMFDVSGYFHKEITRLPEIISNFHRFEERYGIENSGIWLNVNRIFKEYESQLDIVLIDKGLASVVPSFKRRAWFLNRLAGDDISESTDSPLAEALPEFDRLISSLMSRYRADLFSYKKMVKGYVEQKTQARNQGQIAGLVGSMLRLLTHLREKKVAIRDLKPENIFVTGESDNIQISLSSDKGVELGLIDFETAVSLKTSSIKKLEQPLIGGTPSYATPSNFIPNSVIRLVYTDVPRIMHLQDWQACLCMVYAGATGESLFSKSRNHIFDIIKEVQNSGSDRYSVLEVFKKGSCLFWNSAKDEFFMKTRSKAVLLESIEVKIFSKTREMFKSESAELSEKLTRSLGEILARQQLFKNRDSIDSLRKCDPEVIARYRQKWEKGVNIPKTSWRVRGRIIEFLNELEALKNQQVVLESIRPKFENPHLEMRVAEILNFMFSVVLYSMHYPDWRMGFMSLKCKKDSEIAADSKDANE